MPRLCPKCTSAYWDTPRRAKAKLKTIRGVVPLRWVKMSESTKRKWKQGLFAEFDGSVPETISYRDTSGHYRYVSLKDARLSEIVSHMAILRENVVGVQKRYNDLEAFHEFVSHRIADGKRVRDVLTSREVSSAYGRWFR